MKPLKTLLDDRCGIGLWDTFGRPADGLVWTRAYSGPPRGVPCLDLAAITQEILQGFIIVAPNKLYYTSADVRSLFFVL